MVVGCEKKQDEVRCVSGAKEVLPEICDDGKGIAYFSYGNEPASSNNSVLKLITYRGAWTEKFPNKEIIAVNITTYSGSRAVCIIWYRFRDLR